MDLEFEIWKFGLESSEVACGEKRIFRKWEVGGGRRNEVFIDKLRKRVLILGIAFEFGIVIVIASWLLAVEIGRAHV